MERWTEVSVEQLHDPIERDADEIEQFSDLSFGIHTLDVMFNEVGVQSRSTSTWPTGQTKRPRSG